jgi:peptidoglycan-associated lipoprotein
MAVSARLLTAFGVGLVLMSSACKKPTAVDGPPPAPPPLIMQIVSVEPSTVTAGEAFGASVYGAGFTEGSRVWFGGVEQQKIRLEGMNVIKVTAGAMDAGVYDVIVETPSGGKATLRSGLTVKAKSTGGCDFVRVYFDYDQSFVRSDASSELSKNVGCWQARTTPISIEGHCDERGTVEYNIALGTRRAQSAKSYLQNQGISGSRITTVSYGEERPVARGGGESAYSQNRRADIYSKE